MSGLTSQAKPTLDQLRNVTITGVGNGEVLTYNSGTGVWENAAASGGAVTALNNAAENRLLTVGATTTELDAESGLTFDGSVLEVFGADIRFPNAKHLRSKTFGGSSTKVFGATTADVLEFGSGNWTAISFDVGFAAARMYLTGAGHLGINSGKTPSGQLTVTAKDASTSALVVTSAASQQAGSPVFVVNETSGSGNIAEFQVGGTAQALFDSSGYLVIGASSSTRAIYATADLTTLAEFRSTAATSSANDSNVVLSINDGAAMGSGHGLGAFYFAGARDASGTMTYSAAVRAITTEAWSGSASGTKVSFWTTPNGSTSRREVAYCDQNGDFVGLYHVQRSTASGLTASTTQTQAAGTAITTDVAEFSTVANANDAATMPSLPSTGSMTVTVINNGANTLQLFPAVSDNLGAGVDASVTIRAGLQKRFASYDATNWIDVTPSFPMGEISYFNTTGTAITISGTSDGSTNMVVVNPTTALTAESMLFDNGGGNTGRLRYTGAKTRLFHIAATISGTAATPNDVFVLGVAKNGTVNAASKVLGSSGGTQFSSLHAYIQLAQNDYIEIYIGNTTAARNFTVKSLNLFAMGM